MVRAESRRWGQVGAPNLTAAENEGVQLQLEAALGGIQ
jgi:hypothetical protein